MSEKEISYLPLYHRLQGEACLVVGGGDVACRKVEQLLAAGARITIVAPEVNSELIDIIESENIEWRQGIYATPAKSQYRLIIATTDDTAVNRKIFNDCKNLGIPVNVVDQPELCTVIFPSVIRRGPVTISISSGGKVPFLTRELRKELEIFLDNIHFLEYSDLLMTFRKFVQANVEEFKIKKRLYQRLLSSPADDLSKWAEEEAPLELWSQWIASERDE
jgi:siroheme synthase-like protein